MSHPEPNGSGLTRKLLPQRYLRKEGRKGTFLTCVEAPNLEVRIEKGLTVSAARARRFPKGTIFIDGAARSRPFLDSKRRIYNLDHHEGCERPFTLAACEQAMVVILKGLDLRVGEWTIFANEPDLDAVLAIWILLNHTRLGANGAELRKRIMPVVRLQGVIDAHGLELRELAALPEEVEQESLAVLERLRAGELALKRAGKWSTTDYLAHTEQVLRELDELVYTPQELVSIGRVEELARIEVGEERAAFVCRAEDGIYEVEQRLRKLHGDRLGLLILQKESAIYTVRQVDPFLPTSLDELYDRLNQLDPLVQGENRWGGSGDIGGSPRSGGTGMTVEEISAVCRWVYEGPSLRRRLATVLGSFVLAAATVEAAILLAFGRGAAGSVPGLLAPGGADTIAFLFSIIAVTGGALLGIGARRRQALGKTLYGLRRPLGWTWLTLLPLALVAALLGGSSAPLHLVAGPARQHGVLLLLVPLVAALATELLFRGAVHGSLARQFHIQRPGSRWFLSVPTVLAASMSSITAAALLVTPGWLPVEVGRGMQAAGWMAALMALGLSLGMVRERSGSLLAAVAVHVVAALTAWLLVPLLAA